MQEINRLKGKPDIDKDLIEVLELMAHHIEAEEEVRGTVEQGTEAVLRELRTLREASDAKFDSLVREMNARFEALVREVNSRFESSEKRSNFMMWFVGIAFVLTNLLIVLLGVLK